MRTLKLKKLKRVHGIHFSPDGRRLLAVGGDEARMIDSAVWLDLQSGENAGRIDRFGDCYAVDPRLTRYVLGGANKYKRGRPPVGWTPLDGGEDWHEVPSPPRRAIVGLAFDTTGARLAIASEPARNSNNVPNTLSVFRFESQELLTRLETTHTYAQVIAFNNDGTRIAVTGGLDGDTGAEVFDLAAGKQVYRHDPPATVTRAVLLLPDDRLAVASGRNVYILPPDRPDPLFTLAGHPRQVNAVTLTPDGARLLTASHDGSIRIWNAGTGEPVSAFDWQIGPVTAVAFAPDGLTCAAVGINGKVVVWDVDG